MSKTIIGVSGDRGSFSEEAAEHYARKHKINNIEIKYLISVENVLNELDKGGIKMGIFPIENSNGGIVLEAVHAMSRFLFRIKNIFEIDVRHCLLAKPGTRAGDITSITSHDQALKQCRMYLKRRWGETDLAAYADTAEAAKDLGSGKLPATTAVIAPRGCAELYGLEILEEGIQDLKFNFTSFIAAAKS